MKGADIRFPCQKVVTDWKLAFPWLPLQEACGIFKKHFGLLQKIRSFFCSKQTQVCKIYQQGNHHKLTAFNHFNDFWIVDGIGKSKKANIRL